MTAKKKLRFLDFGAAAMWAVAWIVVAYTLATPVAAFSSALAAMSAFFVGRYLSGSNLRTPSVVIIAAAATPLLVGLARWPARSPLAASLFPTPESLMLFTDFLIWGLLSAVIVSLLQFLSNRYQMFVSLEVVVVALFLATPFAAHRDGFINRPYFLIDPLWSRGYDPVPILQAIGVVVAISLILLTIGRATERSSILDLILLCALALGLYLYIPQETLKDLVDDPRTSAGLTGDPSEAQQEDRPPPQGSGGPGNQPMSGNSGGGSSSNEPFPFETSSEKPKAQPVAVVVFRDDYDSPDGYYYFRQTAFSQFNGFRLVKDITGKADDDLFKRFPTKTETVPPPPPRLDIKATNLETRVALISSHTEPFGLVAPLEMKPASNPNPDQFERAYDVKSLVYSGDYSEILASDLNSPVWTPELKKFYLGYPDNDPRYKKLADQIVATVDPTYRDFALAKALAITLYLGEHGKYTTKKRSVGASEDPTADFLFGDMTGYCVHFSHSAVYLMRAAGIPARVGAGYAVESRNRRGSALLILSSAAHAWPEVWINGLGWYPLDVAPAVNLDTPEPPPDFDLQAMLAEMARNEEDKPYEQPKEFDLRKFLRMLIGMVWSFLPWVIGAALFAAYGLKIERRLAPFFEKDENAKINAMYRAALDKVGEAGFRRKFGQGRLGFAEEHRRELPNLAPLTKAHLSLSMGGKGGFERYDLTGLQSNYKQLAADLAKVTPAWRRFLGVLNPLSWLWTR